MQIVTLVAVLCALAFFSGAEADSGLGECPDTIKPMQNFNLAKYGNEWYEVSRLGVKDSSWKCYRYIYVPFIQGGAAVINDRTNTKNHESVTFVGHAELEDNSRAAKLMITIFEAQRNISESVWVLDSDYKNYAVAYSCNGNNFFKEGGLHVLSRTPVLSPKEQTKVDSLIDYYGFDRQKMYTHTQDCVKKH